jgi:hypothetical protein
MSSINNLKSKAMKKIKILLPVLIVAVCMVIWVSCDKTDDFFGKGKQEVLSENTSVGLDTFIQNHFEKEASLSLEKSELRSVSIAENIYSDFSNPSDAEAIVKSLDTTRLTRSQYEEKYVDYFVKTMILESSIKESGNITSFNVYVYCKFFTNVIDESTGKPSYSAEVGLYNIKTSKKPSGFSIIEEMNINWAEGPEYEEFVNDPEVSEPEPFFLEAQLRASAYNYSRSSAVTFARAYYNKIPKNIGYIDYSDPKGDCTNFLSWCLSKGGWPQNNSWFFISSDGSSGNDMKKYNRSPSWTGADQFYQYISATGSMYLNSKGNKRVTQLFKNLVVPNYVKDKSKDKTWISFYNYVKTLNVGDIVEIGNGAKNAVIGHNMIVTVTSSKPPYVKVTYRNSIGNNNYLDRPIDDISSGKILYGFKVNSSGPV